MIDFSVDKVGVKEDLLYRNYDQLKNGIVSLSIVKNMLNSKYEYSINEVKALERLPDIIKFKEYLTFKQDILECYDADSKEYVDALNNLREQLNDVDKLKVSTYIYEVKRANSFKMQTLDIEKTINAYENRLRLTILEMSKLESNGINLKGIDDETKNNDISPKNHYRNQNQTESRHLNFANE